MTLALQLGQPPPRQQTDLSKVLAMQRRQSTSGKKALRQPVPRKHSFSNSDTAADIDRWVASVLDSDSESGSDSEDDSLDECDYLDLE